MPIDRARKAYLWMRLDNSHSPRPMRLLSISPEEIMFLDFQWRGLFSLLLGAETGCLRFFRGQRGCDRRG